MTLRNEGVVQPVRTLLVTQEVVEFRIPSSSPKDNGTKPHHNWRLEESKKFTVAPAYNKGAYQVIPKKEIKDIGR